MPGQFGEELGRYGAKLAAGLGRLGKAIETGTQELRKEAGKTIDELKEEGKRGAKWVREEGLPKAREKLGAATEVVVAHGDLTARRFGAEAKEVLRDGDALEKAKASQFELAKLLFNRKVSMSPLMREYLTTEHAELKGFDNIPGSLKGLPVYPSAKSLKHLEGEFVPVRIYLTSTAIQARVYEQNPPEEHAAGKPQYKYKGERPATADDLFQLQITPEQVGSAIDGVRQSKAFEAFRASKK